MPQAPWSLLLILGALGVVFGLIATGASIEAKRDNQRDGNEPPRYV